MEIDSTTLIQCIAVGGLSRYFRAAPYALYPLFPREMNLDFGLTTPVLTFNSVSYLKINRLLSQFIGISSEHPDSFRLYQTEVKNELHHLPIVLRLCHFYFIFKWGGPKVDNLYCQDNICILLILLMILSNQLLYYCIAKETLPNAQILQLVCP